MTTAASPRPVVAGVSEAGRARAAITLAATEAACRQAPLIAVTAHRADSQGVLRNAPGPVLVVPDTIRIS